MVRWVVSAEGYCQRGADSSAKRSKIEQQSGKAWVFFAAIAACFAGFQTKLLRFLTARFAALPGACAIHHAAGDKTLQAGE